MACVRASFEQLAVRGEEGMSWDEGIANVALLGASTYDTAVIKLTTKLDSNLLLLDRHVIFEKFTVDAVVAEEEEEEEEGGGGGGGVLSFIQERLVGGNRKPMNRNNKANSSTEAALREAWMACKVKGYHGLHVFAKVTPATMPNNPCRQRYTPGQYAEALLNGFRAYYMFQRHHTLFEADALGLWGGGGGGCVEPVNVCYLVLAWQLSNQGRGGITHKPTSLLNITATAAATAQQRQGRKRASVTQNTGEGPLTPARKRMKVTGKAPIPPSPETSTTTTTEEEEEEEEVTVNSGQQRDRIPDVWYSPDISLAKQQQSSPPKVTSQKASPQRLASQKASPQRLASQGQSSPPKPANQPPSPWKVTNQPSTSQKVEQEVEDDLGDLTFGFERSTPRGRGRRTTTTRTTPGRKSVLQPQWPEEKREELLRFFDTLNPDQTEQTCIALTCKFATMRFGQDLSSKQLYQWVQQKGRSVHPRLDSYTLPGGTESTRATAAELFHSLNPDVSESKRVAFTCRFLETQYGARIHSKELYTILSGGGKKRGGRGGKAC